MVLHVKKNIYPFSRSDIRPKSNLVSTLSVDRRRVTHENLIIHHLPWDEEKRGRVDIETHDTLVPIPFILYWTELGFLARIRKTFPTGLVDWFI